MSIDRIYELMTEAEEIELWQPKSGLIKQAVQLADEMNETQLAYDIRMELVRVAIFSGANQEALLAFSWCVAQHDAQPGEFDDSNLIWRYKWILGALPGFPTISRSQISSMTDDMQERTLANGHNLRPIHYMRWTNLMRMGRFEEAEPLIEKWRATPRDSLADCLACERDKYAELLIYTGRYQEAVDYAQPLLSGEMNCSMIPHATYAEMIEPYLKLNQIEQAAEMHQKGYEMIATNPNFLRFAADHFTYVTRIRDFDRGLNMLQQHLPWAVAESAAMDRRFHFYTAAAAFCTAAANQGKATINLQTPPRFALYSAGQRRDTTELATWFDEQATMLAEQFNARNGNQYFSQVQANIWQLADVPR